MRKRSEKKNNSWENLQGFRYAHRGLFHQPRSASKKAADNTPFIRRKPLWKEEIGRWKAEGRRIIPENSMKAFRQAVRHGFGSELDVHLTTDGKLVVFHDDNLLRMAGINRLVKDMSWKELSEIQLLDTPTRIPLLEEVLDLYTSGKAMHTKKHSDTDTDKRIYLPLIIELKSEGNISELCRRVMETIDRYPALNYCIESFDPRVVLWFRRHRPDVIRGQLTENFMKSREAVRQWGYLMTFGMWSVAPDVLSRPDFISCKFKDRRNPFIRLSHRMGVGQVNWIIRNQEELKVVDREGGLGIFERFLPDR